MNWNAEPYYAFWCNRVVAQWTARLVAPEPEPGPSLWEIEKSRNRLQRMTERIENRSWVPKFAYRVNGRALRELREAHELLATAGEIPRKER
jgi:hypothetical protein